MKNNQDLYSSTLPPPILPCAFVADPGSVTMGKDILLELASPHPLPPTQIELLYLAGYSPLARARAWGMHRSKRISWGLCRRRLLLPFQRRQAWASISRSAGGKNRQRRGVEGGGEGKSWEGGGGRGAREGWVTWRRVLSFRKRRAELSSPQYHGERRAVLRLGYWWAQPWGAAPPGRDAAQRGVFLPLLRPLAVGARSWGRGPNASASNLSPPTLPHGVVVGREREREEPENHVAYWACPGPC